jgi:translocation and assembly module TamB
VAASDSLAGAITVRGSVTGTIDSLGVSGAVRGSEVVAGSVQARTVRGRFALAGLPRVPAGDADFDVDTMTVGGVRLRHAAAAVTLEDRESGRFRADVEEANGTHFAAGGGVRLVRDSLAVALDSLTATLDSAVWRLTRPVLIEQTPAGLTVDTLLLRGSRGGWVALGGAIPEREPVDFSVRADSVPLADVGRLAQSSEPLGGTAAFQWTVAGPRERPTMQYRGTLTAARFGDVRLARVAAVGGYADRRLAATLNVFRDARNALEAQLSLPVDLSLTPVAERLLDEPLRGTVRADSVSLGLLEAFTSGVRQASGNLDLNVTLGGTWAQPTVDGTIAVADGAMTLPNLGVRLQRIAADVRLAKDSVEIRGLSATTPGRRQGSIQLRGGLDLADHEDPSFDLTLTANYFHAIGKASVADLFVSTGGATPLHLVGSARRSRLTGSVFIPAGQIYIPELVNKKVISLDDPEFYSVVDTTLSTNRTLLPEAPPEIVRNLTIDNVRIRMGEDVWLRSSEANINLGGDLGVTLGRAFGSDTARAQLALDGTLNAVRGTYRLDLGFALQRTFEVESGTLQFFGEPELNPTLNISALHVVHATTQQDRDVPIRVTITGTLAQPTLTLSSADPDLQLSESDAISYLITGQPSFVVIGNGAQYGSQAASVLLPSLGSYFGDRVANALGLDVVQIETSGVSAGESPFSTSVLANTRLGGGVQIGSRTFLRANVGLCPVQQLFGGTSGTGSGDPYSGFVRSIGAKVEYRLSPVYSASVGIEPPTNSLICQTQGVASPAFIPTPPQFGLDLTRKWDF